jgi:hypothetical protein
MLLQQFAKAVNAGMRRGDPGFDRAEGALTGYWCQICYAIDQLHQKKIGVEYEAGTKMVRVQPPVGPHNPD